MKVYFIGAGPGAKDLVTLRAARILEKCDVCIYAGSLVNPEILEHVNPDAAIHDSSKLNIKEIVDLYKAAAKKDQDVARLHTGDPSIYGAINEQIRELKKLGIEYEITPGVSSFQAAAACIGSELTIPEISQTVILTRISGKTKVPEAESLDKLAATRATLCVFLSASRIREVVEVVAPFYGTGCPAYVVYKGTWPEEIIIRGSLADIADKTVEAGISKTAIIIIGTGLDLSGPMSRLYDPAFSHGFREGVH